MPATYELERESDERLFSLHDVDCVCPQHFHRKIEILYVVNGHKKIIVADKEYELTQNQIFIADSYLMHGYKESLDSVQTVIVIPNHMLKDFYLLYGNMSFNSCFILDVEKALDLKPLIDAIVNKDRNPLIVRANINLLLGKLVELIGMKKREAIYSQQFVEDVLGYINENYKDNLTLDVLSSHFGYSKYYFSRMFNSILHSNLTNYLTTVRLQNTIDLLKTGNYKIGEAAFECGFSSIPTFYRAIKKNYNYKNIKDIINE